MPDADLVAIIIPHKQPRVSHKQKIRVSYVQMEQERRGETERLGAGIILLPGRGAYCVLLINTTSKPIRGNSRVENVLFVR